MEGKQFDIELGRNTTLNDNIIQQAPSSLNFSINNSSTSNHLTTCQNNEFTSNESVENF